jgi:hypothetical protein
MEKFFQIPVYRQIFLFTLKTKLWFIASHTIEEVVIMKAAGVYTITIDIILEVLDMILMVIQR